MKYVTFEGEQHGFRKAENIIRSLEEELYFYGAVFGFTPADPMEPVAIDNLEQRTGSVLVKIDDEHKCSSKAYRPFLRNGRLEVTSTSRSPCMILKQFYLGASPTRRT